MRRVYIREEVWEEVSAWALDQWIKYKERDEAGKAIFQNFPESLARYVEHLKKGGGKNGI